MSNTLKGWVAFIKMSNGLFFFSDSYRTEHEVQKVYPESEGYIDLSLIPEAAIKRVKK